MLIEGIQCKVIIYVVHKSIIFCFCGYLLLRFLVLPYRFEHFLCLVNCRMSAEAAIAAPNSLVHSNEIELESDYFFAFNRFDRIAFLFFIYSLVVLNGLVPMKLVRWR